MPDFDDWDKDANGHLKVWPMQGFATAVFNGEKGGLRLEIGPQPKPGELASAVQIVLTAAQLQNLSDALSEVADRLAAIQKQPGHA
jgi:hypothetical protein